jgi:hypothetical protein
MEEARWVIYGGSLATTSAALSVLSGHYIESNLGHGIAIADKCANLQEAYAIFGQG